MSASVKWSGLDELQEALRNLPADLTAEASHIVEGAANGAAADIKGAYPVRTGNLRDHLTVTHFDQGKFAAGAVVKNTAKHAWLYDNGSQARHYFSKSGARHETGTMWGKTPPTHLFVRAVIKARRRMYDALKDLLVRHGLQVSGEP